MAVAAERATVGDAMNGWTFLGILACALTWHLLTRSKGRLPSRGRRFIDWVNGEGALPESTIEKKPMPWAAWLATATVTFSVAAIATYRLRAELHPGELFHARTRVDLENWFEHSGFVAILGLCFFVVILVVVWMGARAGARFGMRRRGTPMEVFCCSAAGAAIQVWMITYGAASGGGGSSSSSSSDKSDGYSSGGGSFGGGGASGSW